MPDSPPRPIPNARVSARAIYQTIRRDGEEEMARPMGSLWWSGVAAGIAISTSVIAEGLLGSISDREHATIQATDERIQYSTEATQLSGASVRMLANFSFAF